MVFVLTQGKLMMTLMRRRLPLRLLLRLLLVLLRSLIVGRWSLLFLRPMLLSSGLFRIRGFPAAFDEAVSLWVYPLASTNTRTMHCVWPYLEGVLTAEALVTVATRERFHRQMYTLVTLQIVVTAEALRALVALERPIRLRMVKRTRVVMVGHRSHAQSHTRKRVMGPVLWLWLDGQRRWGVAAAGSRRRPGQGRGRGGGGGRHLAQRGRRGMV